jgi:glycosyltransferase involved in cell wall biosynthesis
VLRMRPKKILMISPYRGHGTLPKYFSESFDFLNISYQFPHRYEGSGLVYCDEYRNGQLVSSRQYGSKASSVFIALRNLQPALLQIPITLFVLLAVARHRSRYDVFLIGSLSPISVILKIMGVSSRAVFISCDVYEFEGNIVTKVFNSFEIMLDKLLLNSSDEVWYVSPRLMSVKAQQKISKRARVSKVVPYGVDMKWSSLRELHSIERHSLAYFGAVVPRRGLELVIDSLSDVVKSVPDAKFKIIGEGIPAYEDSLRKKVRENGLQKAVEFLRFEDGTESGRKNLAKCAVGIALYDSTQKSIRFTDSLKIKDYLSCGLPVIVSELLPFSQEIEAAGAGSSTPNDRRVLANLIVRYLTDDEFWIKKSAAALKFASKYDYRKIYTSAFESILKKLEHKEIS